MLVVMGVGYMGVNGAVGVSGAARKKPQEHGTILC
jgi:hypothetical protein